METMSCTESNDFLKLFGCLVDIGTDVVGGSLETNILQKYNGSLQRYLDDKDNKHRFHHQMDNKKLKCCSCPQAGCSIPRKHKMDHWIFKSVYNIDPDQSKKDHVKSRNGFAREICLSQYIAKDVSSESLDLVILVYFLVESEVLLPNERDAVMYIHEIRNRLCHLKKKTYQFSTEELNDMWMKLEEAIVCLVFPKQFKKTVKGQIQALRNSTLGEHDVSRLSGKLRELSSFIFGDTEGEGAAGNNLLSALSAVVTEDRRDMKKQVKGDLLGVLEFTHEAFKITMKMMEDRSRVPQNGCKTVNESQKCTAISYSDMLTGKFNEVKESLLSNKNEKNDDDIITVESVERGCVQIELSAHPSIFDNEDSLYRAIQSLIGKVIDAINLGSDTEHVIDITWIFKGALNEAQKGSIGKLIKKAGTRKKAMVHSADIKSYDSGIFLSTTASHTDQCAIEFCSKCPQKDELKVTLENIMTNYTKTKKWVDEYFGTLSTDNSNELTGFSNGLGTHEDECQRKPEISTEDIDSAELISENSYNMLSKLSYLTTILFTSMIQKIVKSSISKSGKALDQVIQMNSFIKAKFTAKELLIMQTGIGTTFFDFVLSYKILRHLMPVPIQCWVYPYGCHDLSISDSVEKMNTIRNEVAHLCNLNVCNAQFNSIFQISRKIAHSIDKYFVFDEFEKQVVALEEMDIAFLFA